ncbi:hypothetical protein AYI70_g11388 [Smittium culicis]|uniref:AB hydrolase-1 domain-containing protein n=1 Tax=Smittium culicis TaxID=133412 RepID=A0A1R1X213_9FUNG|nr:hypothetical protein AYI70_g11388 [Smittium culicis]
MFKVKKLILNGHLQGTKLIANEYIFVNSTGLESLVPHNLANGKKKLTLFFTHANGFSKELWIPIITRLSNILADDQRFDRAIAVDYVPFGDSAIANRDYFANNSYKCSMLNYSRDVVATYGLYKTENPNKNTAASDKAAAIPSHIYKLKCDPIHEAGTFNGGYDSSSFTNSRLEQVLCPVLFVRARQTNLMYSMEQALEYVSKFRNIEFKIAEDCGHLFIMEVPDIATELIVNFLDKHNQL